MREPLKIVGIGGTTRAGSSTEKALRVALRCCQGDAKVDLFTGTELAQLPHYAPEQFDRHPVAVELVTALRAADGVLLASPGYHGGMSGLMKNALDYIEDLREDDRPYLAGRAVGCIATGSGWQAIVTTIQSLRAVVHALRGWPTPLAAAINTSALAFDEHGVCTNERDAFQLDTVGREVMEFARAWSADAA